VPRSKHGGSRQVPINSVVRAMLFDLSLRRQRPADPTEPVLPRRYTEASKFFPKVVERAQGTLRESGQDPSRLDGYTWHGNRHTFASRLVMGGMDLRTVQELGGWKTLKMVARYAHLSPAHLHAAVERLATGAPTEQSVQQTVGAATELERNFNAEVTGSGGVRSKCPMRL
jgi:site-specific recombinase XerD